MDAGADAVWAALSESRHTAAWIGPMVGAPAGVGSRFTLWHEQEVPSEHVVLEWDRPRLLRVTWDFPGEPPSEVTFVLEDTVLRVLHEGLADPVPYAAGWHRHLDFLRAHLAGHDLPMDRFWDDHAALLALYRP